MATVLRMRRMARRLMRAMARRMFSRVTAWPPVSSLRASPRKKLMSASRMRSLSSSPEVPM
eukprot:10858763-Lingulodinium_polyedra.AAC.1